MAIFHINKHGLPAICKAKAGNCPLGENEVHFKSKEEAQTYADEKHKEEFGILPKKRKTTTQTKTTIKEKKGALEKTTVIEENIVIEEEYIINKPYRKARSKYDKDYISKRKKFLRNEASNQTYIERCRSCVRLNNYKPNGIKTRHFNEDRDLKSNDLIRHFGEGNIVGHYEVDHLIGKIVNNNYKKQIIEIRDNGRMIIYDKTTGKTVTTFMAHKSRAEAMMIMANEIPDRRFLQNVEANRCLASEYNLN